MWQWGWFNTIGNQVIQYSTFFGKVWYIVVFVFRLIVVLGLGSSVYGDEQSNFRCSAKQEGCNQACYNQFTLVSHLRFWGFQLLAIFTPVIIFHFLTLYLNGQLAKIKADEEKDSKDYRDERHQHYEEKKTRQRKMIVGKTKHKQVFVDGQMKEILVNRTIQVAHYVSVISLLIIEAVFLYLTYQLYNYPDYLCQGTSTLLSHLIPEGLECKGERAGLHFLWATFPEIYPCRRLAGSGVFLACTQNVAFNSVVPCWTSRAFEKTVFLRYMNILSVISFILCALEILWIPVKRIWHASNKRSLPRVDERSHSSELRPYYGDDHHRRHPPRDMIYSTQESRRGSGQYYDQHQHDQIHELSLPRPTETTSAKRPALPEGWISNER